MCNAPAVGVAMGLQVGGGILSAINQQEAGEDTADYYNYLSGVAIDQGNAIEKTAGENARLIDDAAQRDKNQLKLNARKFAASQRATMAANGVDLGSGTAGDIAKDTFNTEQLDEMAIQFNADTKKKAILDEAIFKKKDLYGQAYGYGKAGQNARTAADRNVYSTLLGSASQVANTWSMYKAGK